MKGLFDHEILSSHLRNIQDGDATPLLILPTTYSRVTSTNVRITSATPPPQKKTSDV